ncbi:MULTISPECIES: hypothetical protein [Streptacidiphilus]|uniref:STAS domain-containing protein n=1 Tax=Streptacidiphilus cavernicola TaxID=3342716 RepID=A0ABV6V1I3_9ACTN|nr:hypothetical protein [Streptacidiphilus jeojiense]
MTYQDRRALRVHPGSPGCLVASVHGVVNAALAQRIADKLAGLIGPDTREVHLDVDQANPMSAAAAAVLFFPVLEATGSQGTVVTFTVHRAGDRTRTHMHELGLDRLLSHSDEPA